MPTYIGLIGGGNITDTHARAALAIPGVEISAIYGTHPEKTAKLCANYGGSPFADIEKFMAHRPMDLVIIGSPSGLHAEHGIKAARHGLHVLTEKPIDISTARADALVAECEKSKVKLGVLFQDRTKPDVHRLKKFLAEGALGKLILADAQVKWHRSPEYYGNSSWRGKLALDGGALLNQGVHTVDLLLWLMGDVVSVQAQMATSLHNIEAEDTITALLEFANGAIGTLIATTSAYPGYPRRIELTGSEGTVILEHDKIIRADLKTPRPELLNKNESADQNQSATSATVSDTRGHQALIEDFLRAIKTNSRPLCDGIEARRSVALIEAIYEAARSGERTSVV
nr:Gfo/Idh/MocA family oxidoreductase [Candidatus Acidoferrales bacterium]